MRSVVRIFEIFGEKSELKRFKPTEHRHPFHPPGTPLPPRITIGPQPAGTEISCRPGNLGQGAELRLECDFQWLAVRGLSPIIFEGMRSVRNPDNCSTLGVRVGSSSTLLFVVLHVSSRGEPSGKRAPCQSRFCFGN